MTMAVGLLIRLWMPSGLQYTDAGNYARVADLMARGEFSLEQSAYHVRLGFTVPLAGFVKTLGMGEYQILAYPLLCSMASILLAYALTTVAFGRGGLIAACLVASAPLSIVQASDVHTDGPMALWLGLAVLGVLQSSRGGIPSVQRLGWAVSVGVCLGLAYLTKLSALAFLPAVVLLGFLRKLDRKTTALAALGFLAVVGTETLTYFAVTGDAAYRLNAEFGSGTHFAQVSVAYGDRLANIRSALFEIPSILFDPRPGASWYGLHMWLLLPAVLMSRTRRTQPAAFAIAAYLTALYIPLSFGTVDFTRWAPIQLRSPRITEPLLLPAAVLAAAWLTSVRRTTAYAVILPVLGVAAVAAQSLSLEARQQLLPLRTLVSSGVLSGCNPVFADPWNFDILHILMAGEDTSSRLKPLPRNPPKYGCVIVDKRSLAGQRRWQGLVPPAWIEESPGEMIATHGRFEPVRGGLVERLRTQRTVAAIWALRPLPGGDLSLFRVPAGGER